jgi:hypothetical protein
MFAAGPVRRALANPRRVSTKTVHGGNLAGKISLLEPQTNWN